MHGTCVRRDVIQGLEVGKERDLALRPGCGYDAHLPYTFVESPHCEALPFFHRNDRFVIDVRKLTALAHEITHAIEAHPTGVCRGTPLSSGGGVLGAGDHRFVCPIAGGFL